MTTHQLKTWPNFFEAVVSGEKTFEVRLDDRGFQSGDEVLLREWDPDSGCTCRSSSKLHVDDCPRYTGRQVAAWIGWVLASTPRRGNVAGFEGRGYVVFSVCEPQLIEPVRPVVDVEPPAVPVEQLDRVAVQAREAAQRIHAAAKGGPA